MPPANTWRLRTPWRYVSPRREGGPDGCGEVLDPYGGSEISAAGLELPFLRDTWRHRIFPERGAGPGPFAGRLGLRTTGVRLLGRQGVAKDNYETLA